MGMVKGVVVSQDLLKNKILTLSELVTTVLVQERAENNGMVGMFSEVQQSDGTFLEVANLHTGINSEPGLHRLQQAIATKQSLGGHFLGLTMGRPSHFVP